VEVLISSVKYIEEEKGKGKLRLVKMPSCLFSGICHPRNGIVDIWAFNKQATDGIVMI
jgi:hypothetical protein